MNTTATLKDWIINSVTDVTAIDSTMFAYRWEINQHQKPYPLFMLEPPDFTTQQVENTASGVKRDYQCNLWFFSDSSGDWEDVMTTLENYAFTSLKQIERNRAFLFKPAGNEYKFTFYEYVDSDRVKALQVSVTYAMNTCVDISDD